MYEYDLGNYGKGLLTGGGGCLFYFHMVLLPLPVLNLTLEGKRLKKIYFFKFLFKTMFVTSKQEMMFNAFCVCFIARVGCEAI